MLAGMVTAGMIINPDTGQVTGLPKPFSVDRSPQLYKDLLETVNEVRVALPRYALLRRELCELEFIQPGKPPDHRVGSSKDVADAVAGVIGYLSVFGHGKLGEAAVIPITSETVVELSGLPPVPDFSVEGDTEDDWDLDHLADPIDFGIY